jgi:hypothetical protein
MFPSVRRQAGEQTDAADEAGASDGASPLICVFGEHEISVGAGESPLGEDTHE